MNEGVTRAWYTEGEAVEEEMPCAHQHDGRVVMAPAAKAQSISATASRSPALALTTR